MWLPLLVRLKSGNNPSLPHQKRSDASKPTVMVGFALWSRSNDQAPLNRLTGRSNNLDSRLLNGAQVDLIDQFSSKGKCHRE